MSKAEYWHSLHGEPVEPLSVFYGKPEFQANPDVPPDSELSPFPIGLQENGLPMPQWDDLSQWMKVMMAVMVCHQWDLVDTVRSSRAQVLADAEGQEIAS